MNRLTTNGRAALLANRPNKEDITLDMFFRGVSAGFARINQRNNWVGFFMLTSDKFLAFSSALQLILQERIELFDGQPQSRVTLLELLVYFFSSTNYKIDFKIGEATFNTYDFELFE